MKTDHVQVRLEPDLRSAVQARARAEERTVSGWIRHLIRRELGLIDKEPTAEDPAA